MLKILIAAAAAVLIAGASTFSVQAADQARVRVLHASPDAPNVDVYANGNRVLSNVPFKTASDYLAVPAGTYTFEVRPAGAAANSTPVISATADLGAGMDYTVAAVDKVAQISARILVDNNAMPAAGKAHVQVLHASPDAGPVDVALKGGPVLVPNLPFGEQQGPLPVDAGTYDLEVRAAGTSTVALPLDGVRLEAGKVYTFAAVGLAQGQPALSVLPIAYTPMPVTVPSTGDAGLLDAQSDERGSSYLPWAAAAVAAGLLGFAAIRLARAEARN
jgi:hypothetical protein